MPILTTHIFDPTKNRLRFINRSPAFRLTDTSQFLTFFSLSVCIVLFFSTNQTFLFAQDKSNEEVKEIEKTENPDQEKSAQTKPEAEIPTNNSYPSLEEMLKQIPSAKDLVQKPPVDWIVLETDNVIPVMQVFPRPDTVDKMYAAIKVFDKEAPPRTTEEQIEEHQEKRKKMHYLDFSIYEDAKLKIPRLFLIHISRISEIIYYEELMLKRINILRKAFRIRDAFELLHQLRRRSPNWKGIDNAHDQILFSAAKKHAKAKQFEDAIVKLEELHRRNAKFPQLKESMGKIINILIQNSINKEDYRQGRFFIRRLERYYSKHQIVVKWIQQLTNQCRELVTTAKNSYKDKKYRKASITIKKAAIVWPRHAGLLKIFNRMCQRYQILRVGVLDQTEIVHHPIQSAGNSRYLDLTESHLFELDHIEDVPHYRTRYFEKWTPTDLGRLTIFDLRPGRSYWESKPVTHSSDIVNMLRNKLDPNHPFYDQRLEYFIDSISIKSPYQFEIVFSHVPLKPESLFHFPYPAIPQSKSKYEIPNNLKPSRFQLRHQTKTHSHFTRVKPEPEGIKIGEYHISEVLEVKYDTYKNSVQSLIREQIDYLPRIPPAMAQILSKDPRFFIFNYSIPEVHVIQFNPKSQAIRNRQIRRAMAYGLDLPKILNETYLNSIPFQNAQVTTAPYAKNNYGFNKTIEPRTYDLSAAVPLVLITKKKLGGKLPELKMLVNREPAALKAAKEIVKRWNQLGVPVRILDKKEDSSQWDIAYRTLNMAEPITEMWSFVANDPQHKIHSLTHLPDWIRLELIQLERTSNLNDAVRTLHKLHRHLYEEVEYIPLWEVYQKMAVSKKVAGFSQNPVSPYYNIEKWNVTPWFSRQHQ